MAPQPPSPSPSNSPTPSSDGRIEVYLEAESQARPARISERSDPPFQIAVFGDFSGRGTIGSDGGGALTPTPVDRDDLAQVLRRLGPRVAVSWDQVTEPITVSFESIWDFQPDELEARLPLFRELRARIEDSAAGSGGKPATPAGADLDAPRPSLPTDGGGILEAVLSESEPEEAPRSPQTPGDLAGLIEQALAPYLVKEDPDSEARRSAYEASATDLLRRILTDPAYRSLESLWRGVHLLTQRLETGPHLKVHLVDISKARLRAEVLDGGATDPPLRSLLTAPSAHEVDVSLLAGCYSFDATEEDLVLLEALGELALGANAPWILEATPDLAHVAMTEGHDGSGVAARWRGVRESPGAAYLSVLMPRFRQRLPFSPENGDDPAFFFELENSDHSKHLWGSPVFLAALALGQAYGQHGWQMRPSAPWDVPGLPLLLTTEDGVTRAHPCAEVLFGEAEARSLIEAGITPLMAVKDQDRIRVPGVHPVAPAPFPLGGRWLDAR